MGSSSSWWWCCREGDQIADTSNSTPDCLAVSEWVLLQRPNSIASLVRSVEISAEQKVVKLASGRLDRCKFHVEVGTRRGTALLAVRRMVTGWWRCLCRVRGPCCHWTCSQWLADIRASVSSCCCCYLSMMTVCFWTFFVRPGSIIRVGTDLASDSAVRLITTSDPIGPVSYTHLTLPTIYSV